MTNDFSSYPLLVQLINAFSLKDKPSPDSLLELLLVQDTDNISAAERAKIVEDLSHKCNNPGKFVYLYETLQSKNVKILDNVLRLLNSIGSNPKVKEFLGNAKYSRTNRLINLASVEKTFRAEKPPPLKPRIQEKIVKTDDKSTASASSDTSKAVDATNSIKSVENNLFDKRLYLNSFVPNAETNPIDKNSFLERISPRDQELIACEDILFVLMGIGGRFICYDTKSRSFIIDRHFSQRIAGMLTKILPLAESYYKLSSYIIQKHNSLVYQALNYAIFQIQREYLAFLSELEKLFRSGQLSLQKMIYYKESCSTEMEFVASICTSISNEGFESHKILSFLHKKYEVCISSGVSLKICEFLINSAAAPYFEMIQDWVYCGVINDPHNEFMIKCNESTDLDKQLNPENTGAIIYKLLENEVPIFLSDVSNKILNAGKYLNVLHQCGKEFKNKITTKLTYSFHGETYLSSINDAISYASHSLIEFIIDEKKLLCVLASIRHYFLMDHGDFFVIFMDFAESTLIKRPQDIDISKLESLLEMAIRNSIVSSDPYSENLKVCIEEDDFATYQLAVLGGPIKPSQGPVVSNGIKSLGFTYDVEWPLSLIINTVTIAKYCMLFRHLLYIKYCSRLLSRLWQHIAKSKIVKLQTEKNSSSFLMILVNKMLHFLHNFEYFLQFDIIEPNWNTFITTVPKFESIDDLIRKHNDFLDKTVKDCMLTQPILIQGFTKIIDLCYDFIYSQMVQVAMAESMKTIDMKFLFKTDADFTKSVCAFLDCLYQRTGLHYEHNMLMLAERLDFNRFYSEFKRDQDVVNDEESSKSSDIKFHVPSTYKDD